MVVDDVKAFVLYFLLKKKYKIYNCKYYYQKESRGDSKFMRDFKFILIAYQQFVFSFLVLFNELNLYPI